MANKILIFGATGAVGSSLAKLMQNGSTECHLIGKSQDEVSRLSDETGHSFSVADVLEEGFFDKIDIELLEAEKPLANPNNCREHEQTRIGFPHSF